jgi:hypothetical protein
MATDPNATVAEMLHSERAPSFDGAMTTILQNAGAGATAVDAVQDIAAAGLNALVPGLGTTASAVWDALGMDSLFAGPDHRIGVSSQRLSDAADAAAGLPPRFAVTGYKKGEWRRLPLVRPYKDHAVRLAMALCFYAVFGTDNLGTGTQYDVQKLAWLRKWWNAKAREYSDVAKLCGMPQMRGAAAEKLWAALRTGQYKGGAT